MNEEMKAQEDSAQELTPEEKLLQEKKTVWEAIAQIIRENGKQEHYATLTDLMGQLEMEKDVLLAAIEEMKAQEEYKDICVYEGVKDRYYYTYPLLAHNYVKNVAMAQEDDLPHTIAEVVRYESQTYPRATDIETFTKFPYHYTVIQVKRMLERMQKEEQYQDLQTYESSHKNFYVYSSKFFTKQHATFLIEFNEDKRQWM